MTSKGGQIFTGRRFLFLTRPDSVTLKPLLTQRGGVLIPPSLAANSAAACALALDPQVIAIAEANAIDSVDAAVRQTWSGRILRSAWVTDSVRRGVLQDAAKYCIGVARTRPNAESSSAAAASAAAASTAGAVAQPAAHSVTASESSSAKGKRRRDDDAEAVAPAASATASAEPSPLPAASAAAPTASSSAQKKARTSDPLVDTLLRQHQRTSLEERLQRFNRPASSASKTAAAEHSSDADIANLSRSDQIAAAVASLQSEFNCSVVLIVHALLVCSGRFGVARRYLRDRRMPAGEYAFGPEDDGELGNGDDDAIRSAIERLGKERVQSRCNFLMSVGKEQEAS